MTAIPVRFDPDLIALFSRASHDVNPLHASAEYARKSPFGQPVVFGILGALAAMSKLAPRPEQAPSEIELEFANPFFPHLDYQITVDETAAQCKLLLADGRRPLVKSRLIYINHKHGSLGGSDAPAARIEAASPDPAMFSPGTTFAGKWSPCREAFDELRRRLDLVGKGGDSRHQAALLWASYFIGMEAPGRQALFSRLGLHFEQGEFPAAENFQYRVAVKSYHPLFHLLVLGVELSLGGRRFAHGELRAFYRSAIESATDGEALLPVGDALRGQTALVIGGSRGFGAALVEALARQECTVLVNYARSSEEAELLRRRLTPLPGKVVLLQGDASEIGVCQQIRAQIVAEFGRLDLLICNACPTLLPLWIEPESVARIQDHIARGAALVLSPMAALLPLLAETAGCNVLVSSIAVKKPIAEWPHYVAAKAALEGLMSVATLEYPQVRHLVVRPSRLLTDLTNTPLGKKGAISPAAAAATVARWLTTTPQHSPGQLHFLETPV